MPTPELFRYALESVTCDQPAVLVAVVDAVGSVPGKPGAMLVVSTQGAVGTIGGGIAEHQVIDRVRAGVAAPELLPYDHASEEIDSLCSGRQHFALLPLAPSAAATLREIAVTLEGDGVGALNLSPAGLSFAPGERRAQVFEQHEARWSFTTTLGKLETLTIIGGGHVALALSRVMATLPFRVVVLDDRDDLPTMQSNRFASETRVVDYQRVAEHVPRGELSYVVIMTHAHRADREVLEHLMGHSYAYLGMMGSEAKVAQIRRAVLEDGGNADELERVHAPIGVPIFSRTPEEIAISIAAEIIQVRNRPQH